MTMFGLSRSHDIETIDWPSLHSLLEDDDRRAVIYREYPSEGRESFLQRAEAYRSRRPQQKC